MSEIESLVKETADDTESFGKFYTLISAIIITIISIIIISVGIGFLFKKPDRIKVQGQIISIDGDSSGSCRLTQSNPDLFRCELQIKYSYNGKEYESNIDYQGDNKYYYNEPINIYIKETDYTNISLSKPITKDAAILMIILPLIFLLLAWFWYYAATKWKTVARGRALKGIFSI